MTTGTFAAASLPDDAIELGRVLEAWGIKGWVRIQPHSADTGRVTPMKKPPWACAQAVFAVRSVGWLI